MAQKGDFRSLALGVWKEIKGVLGANGNYTYVWILCVLSMTW